MAPFAALVTLSATVFDGALRRRSGGLGYSIGHVAPQLGLERVFATARKHNAAQPCSDPMIDARLPGHLTLDPSLEVESFLTSALP